MAIITGGTTAGQGTGTVTAVSSANNSIAVANSTTTPALTVGTVDKLHTNNPPAAACAMNGQKFTGLAAGSGAGDSLRYEQVIGSNVLAVGNLVAGTAGQVLGGTGPSYALPPGYEIGYDQITAGVTVTSTTEATPTTLISCAAHTFDGGAVLLTVYFPFVAMNTASSDTLVITLFESTTEITRLATVNNPNTTNTIDMPVCAQFRFTPTAAAHTYTIAAHKSGGTASVGAGSGSGAASPPAFARFVKV